MFSHSRRAFLKSSLSTLPIAGVILSSRQTWAAEESQTRQSKPNSMVAGVQLGLNVPYSFADSRMSGDDILAKCVRLGVSAVELRTQPVEVFLGAPAELVYAKKPAAGAKPSASGNLADWRHSFSIEMATPFRKKYEDAGVLIQIVKVDDIFQMADAELDYVFGLAKALGGRAISTEISHRDEDLQRLGRFADKHQLMVGYHGHGSTRPQDWERAFSFAQYNGANVDLGHFVAGNNTSPVPFISQHHSRVAHVHVKDRKLHNGPNTPFGQGDTPIAEVLRLIRDNHWNIQATVEFEYPIPPGSDRMTEIARAIRYCRDVLS
jgi:sugar phosphate isomerase/epimerase